jgi:hypothetical protein
MASDHNPGDLLQLRHLAWELAGRPFKLRCNGEGRGVQLASWMAGPGFGAYKAADTGKCGKLHLDPMCRMMEVHTAAMQVNDYFDMHYAWGGPKGGDTRPECWMPAYARNGARGMWVVDDPDGRIVRLRLYVTGRGLPRWSALHESTGTWTLPYDEPLHADLVLGGGGTDAETALALRSTLQAPSAKDMRMLSEFAARRKLAGL